MIHGKTQLKEMVRETRAGMGSDIEEGAEDEHVEDNHHDINQIIEKPLIITGRQENETSSPEPIDPDSILRKPGDKRQHMELMTEEGEMPLKRQKLEELEKAYGELLAAHSMFQNAAATYKAVKASIPFINTPTFIKFR